MNILRNEYKKLSNEEDDDEGAMNGMDNEDDEEKVYS